MPTTVLNPSARLLELINQCKNDPVRFNHVILGRQPYWWRQVQIAEAVAKYKTTVVESGNSVGKGYLLAGLILWWLYTRPGSLVVTTAPSQTLLGTVLFKELRKAHAESRIPLGGTITDSATVSPQTLRLDNKGWQVLGIATKGVERFSGQHNVNLFAAVDEASGIEPEIWEALRSQNAAKTAVFGNPIKAEGEFPRLAKMGEEQAKNPTIADNRRIKLFVVPSTESPDIHLERSPRGLADAGFLAEARQAYGEGGLWWQTHIMAIRPIVSSEGLLPEEWLDFAACQKRPEFPGVERIAGPRRLACDLGEGVGRDRTVVLVRDHLGILEVTSSNTWGLPEAATEMKRLATKWSVSDDHCSFDALGIGRDLPNHLVRNRLGARPYRGSASVKGDFANMRSLSAWNLRQRLDRSRDDPSNPAQKQIPFVIPQGPWWIQMRTELEAIKYELVGQKVKLEKKEDLMVRLGHSPDYADSLVQSFCPL